jgi:phosphotransferase system  glucose/maltose/N-acetylglucosamine-specific IIC component
LFLAGCVCIGLQENKGNMVNAGFMIFMPFDVITDKFMSFWKLDDHKVKAIITEVIMGAAGIVLAMYCY